MWARLVRLVGFLDPNPTGKGSDTTAIIVMIACLLLAMYAASQMTPPQLEKFIFPFRR